MRRLLLLTALLAAATGCLKFERTVYRFDLASGTGEVIFKNIMTDDEGNAGNDFAELVNDWILGTKFELDHPGWNVTSKELVANGSQLDGVVKFTFSDPATVGLYKHDKKAPYFYCVEEGDIVSTDGDRIEKIPKCAVWGRKTKTFEIEVSSGDASTGRSLLPEYQGWNGGPVEGGSATGDLATMFGQLGEALSSGMESMMSGGPMIFGALPADQVNEVLNPAMDGLKSCGASVFSFVIAPDGSAKLGDDQEGSGADAIECLTKGVAGLKFPTADSETSVVITATP